MILLLVLFMFSAVWNAETVRAQESETSCRTPNNTIGKCMPQNQCEYLKINKNKPAAVKFVTSTICSVKGNTRKYCCPSLSSAANLTKLTKNCGRRVILNYNILGGENATLGEYPWMAALGYRTSSSMMNTVWLCGGALISERYVLTAAHCTYKTKPYKVRLGVIDVLNDNTKATPKPEDRLIERIITHKEFLLENNKIENDIALLVLEQKVSYNKYIQPICLPIQSQFRAHLENGVETFVAGWGTTSINGPSSRILKYVGLPTVKLDACKKVYDPLDTTVDTRNLCAGFSEGKKDSCQGDSGGPLMWHNKTEGKHYVIGIVSFGRKCGQAGYPGVYTKVSEFIDFLVANID